MSSLPEKIKRAIIDKNLFNVVFTEGELKQAIIEKHGDDTNLKEIRPNLTLFSVNDSQRFHYLPLYGKANINSKIRNERLRDSTKEYSRTSDPKNKYDLLYKINSSTYEVYSKEKHGVYEFILDEDDLNHLIHVNQFEMEITKSLSLPQKDRVDCIRTFSQMNPITSTSYKRNPHIVAERLFLANGYCDYCKNPAPFKRRHDSSPYLEVHHITPLSFGGDDTLNNTTALCPNCHRAAHYA